MPPSKPWLSPLLTLLTLFSLAIQTNALYFYMDGRQTRCFFEELPKDTLVVGTPPSFLPPGLQHPKPN